MEVAACDKLVDPFELAVVPVGVVVDTVDAVEEREKPHVVVVVVVVLRIPVSDYTLFTACTKREHLRGGGC